MAAGDLDARAGRSAAGPSSSGSPRPSTRWPAALGAAERRERAIEAQRRDLIVAVSHDLRTPLADLRAMAEAIEDRVVTDPTTVRGLRGRMAASVESLGELVDDLFEFVQLDAAAIEAERERARVDQVVGWAVAACDGQAAEKGLGCAPNSATPPPPSALRG